MAATRAVDVMTEVLELPAEADEQTALGDRFRSCAELVERCKESLYGEDSPTLSPELALVARRGTSAEAAVTLVETDGETIVGVADIFLPQTESVTTADTMLFVDPDLPEPRRAEIFESLVAGSIEYARDLGRTTVLGGGVAAATGEIKAETGFGGVAPDDPESAAWLRRGASLSQVYRVSRFSLAAIPDLDERLRQAEAAAPDYRTLTWVGETPHPYRSDMRHLHERMSTDAPTGDLELEEQSWSDARLTEFERHKIGTGRTLLSSAVQHVPSGALVGYSQMLISDDPLARQHNLIVLREHRGHGLGNVLKLAGLKLLRDQVPHATGVSTMNAEENQHMIRVNERAGFEPVTHLAVFQLKLGS